jgi:hypothetical protein
VKNAITKIKIIVKISFTHLHNYFESFSNRRMQQGERTTAAANRVIYSLFPQLSSEERLVLADEEEFDMESDTERLKNFVKNEIFLHF